MKSVFDAAKPCRLALVVALLIPIVFINVEQASEVLRCLGEGPAHAGSAKGWQFFLFAIGLTTVSLAGWYFSRVLLYFRFPDSPPISPAVERVMVWLPRLIGVLPSAGLGVAFLLSARPYQDASTADIRTVLRLFAATCFGISVLVFVFFIERRRFMRKRLKTAAPVTSQLGRIRALPRSTRIVLLCSSAGSILVFLSLLVKPVEVAQGIGSGAVILLAATFWICHGSLAVYAAHRYQVPVMGALLCLAAVFSWWNDNHGIRVLPGPKSTNRLDLATYYASWHSNLCAQYPSQTEHPVIIVAAAGGGIRAAFWTATVLGRLQDANPAFSAHVFAISGVSGGSLGAAVFNGLLGDGEIPSYTMASQEILSHDFLSPTLGYMLFPDLVQRFLPIPFASLDRAKALENAWEGGWTSATGGTLFSQDFDALWRRGRAVPALFLNGTSVETGKRMITSNVLIDQTFVDALDVNERLRAPIAVSTAVHMSARFSYVSPAGRFDNREHIVDGGYFENSGTATAMDILDAIAVVNRGLTNPAVPVVIVINNDPNRDRTAETRRGGHEVLGEILAPIQSLLQTREARGAYSEMALAFGQGFSNVFDFDLRASSVPLPLGWLLSQAAIKEMNRQMDEQTNALWQVLQRLPRSGQK